MVEEFFLQILLFAMQLKFKKICLLSTIVIYFASFLIQSDFGLFQAWAQERNNRVNIVAVLVDSKIYSWIKSGLDWYTTHYVQQRLSDTKALVIPLDLKNIHAYDIYRMMENIYFDWLKDVNSTLIGLIMFGDIPLPVVNQNWYIFPTVYPYVDFESQKYVWDAKTQYFIPNNNPKWQAEIWHWLINYWENIWMYNDFFAKIRKYDENADEFIWDSFWYDDFIAQKKGFLNENFPYYRNRVMFAEDLWYQRYSSLMRDLFVSENSENAVDIVSELSEAANIPFDSVETDDFWNSMYTTKMVQQEIDTSLVSDYTDLFSQTSSSTMRENLFAWWRWVKEYKNASWQKSMIMDSDSTISKLQIKDDLLLWNDKMQWLIENLNDLMENVVDKKVEEKNLSMDIVIPVSYQKKTKKRINFRCVGFISRFENHYFGSNARFIDKSEDLSVFRWTYRNLLDLWWVTYDLLLAGKNPIKTDYEKTDLKLKSIWWSYDVFSNQAEWNRWYTMTTVERDLDIYDEEKTTKDVVKSRNVFGRVKKKSWPTFCDDDEDRQCETLYEFAKRWWWWASTINLINESVMAWRYELSGYLATDSWRSIFGMDGFQSLLVGDDEWISGTWWYHWTWTGPQWDATSFRSYVKYASPTQTKWWRKKGYRYEIYDNHTPDVHMDFRDVNYWDLSPSIVSIRSSRKFAPENNSSNIFTVSTKRPSWLKCWWTTEYSYKVINSVVKHKSTTEDQINWIDRDKYSDTWTLWKYYRDVRTEYEELQKDMDDILNEFPGLVDLINSWNNFINEKLKDLYSGANALSQINWDLSNKESQISVLESELEWSKSEISKTKSELYELNSQLEDAKSELENAEEWDDTEELENLISELENSISGLEKTVSDLEGDIENLESDISGLQWEVASLKSKKGTTEDYIISILNEMSKYINLENSELANIYKLIQSLYVENIIGTLAFIAYLEGWNPDDYYAWWNSSNLVQVGFLPSWISNINRIVVDVKKGESKIIDNYEKVYLMLQDQQNSWSTLAKRLKDLSDRYTVQVDKVSGEMDQIFFIRDDGENDGEEIEAENIDDENIETEENVSWEGDGSILLTWWSAREVMNLFEEELWDVSSFFNKLIVEDKVWPTIVKEAKNDEEFLMWLYEQETWKSSKSLWAFELIRFQQNFNSWKKGFLNGDNFSDVDWINHYGQWASWPWYDSDWARKNHDLLIWVSEHMSWMNILTHDRPIDSPRYTVMQSVAGKEMKFIYPDLFKVEVYVLSWKNMKWEDRHILLTWWQIKKNLIKYLTWKVEEYNKMVKEACDKALSMNDYFNRLRIMWYSMATPDVSFRECDEPFKYEDFVEALWWTGMLDTISEVLYYQSLTNKVKFSSWNVEKDIELIRESFWLNEKREQVLRDYLIEWNEETKNPVFEIPTYELSWYEVAYINSDWRDYIFPSDQIGNGEEFSQTVVEASTDSLNIDRRQRNNYEREYDDECNIPPNWRLPLFEIGNWSPWFEGFKCWLKKVKEEPVKLKLTFDDSLWDILTADSFKDFIKNSELGQTFVDRKTSWQKYEDDWTSLLNPSESYDSDKEITEMQVRAEQRNQKRVSWDDSYAYLLSRINENVRIENSNVILSDSNPTSNFKIESIEDIQNITVTFIWTWDSCIKINSNDLCNGKSFSKTFNPKTEPFTWVIQAASHVAWKVWLIMQISAWWDYIERIVKYTISPSALDSMEMKVGDVKTVAWMITPITVTWYDRYNNIVSWWLTDFDFTVSQWRFLKDWAYQDSFTTKDLRNLNFYYQAPLNAADESIAKIQIKSKDGKVWKTYDQRVIQWNPEIKLNWSRILWWRDQLVANTWYKLKSDESIYVWWKLSVSKLQRLDIDMKDSKWNIIDIDTQITVNSQNGLIVLWSVNKQNDWEDVFFETSLGQMNWWHLTLYYYPTTVAGDEAIRIDIPWLDTRIINLKINPGEVYNVQFNIKDIKYNAKKQYVWFHETEYLEVIATDVWWNRTPCVLGGLIYDPRFVEFYPPTPGVFEENRTETVVSNRVFLTDPGSEWYKKIYLYWTWAWATSISLGSPYASIDFKVTKHILPESGLNIMYLNYFWNDWWNQWWYFSDNKKHVESLMTQSNKIITTTTQLVSQNKIKKIVWKIDPWFLITNFENVDTTMIMNWNSINVKIWWLYEMKSVLSSLKWMDTPSITSIFTVLGGEKTRKNNYAFFIPSNSDYKIVDWVLFNDWERVASIINWELTLQLWNQTLDNNENFWNITYKWINYGSLIIHSPDFIPEISGFGEPVDRYLAEKVFSNWSSDSLNSVWVFDWFSDLDLGSSYKSIQNSDELEEKIGFLWDFKNITLFAEWEIVWEATKKYGSELLINLWDPVLSRKSKNEKINGTEFDGGIWQEIYVDSENDIFGTYQIDFDGVWGKDLLVVYLDWTIKLAKNYWWNPDLKNMQDLMRIAVHIRDVFVGDADWNGYEDILVYTDNNQIRAYLNEWWIFDVDGNVACLNQNVIWWQISDTPTDMEGINQFFVDDMDLDGKVDIITYDKKWYIKVFFWWSVKQWPNQWPNYLSTGKYYCDTWWYDREVNNTTVVAALGVQVVGDSVFDNSMIHWNWMKKPTITISEGELPLYWIKFNPKTLEKLIKHRERNSDWSIANVTTEIMDKDKFDVEVASKKFIKEEAKYVEVELFENVLWLTWEKEWNDSNIYTFAPSSYLDPWDPNDKCSTWKNYRVKSWDAVLMDWDIVTVRVTVKASSISACVWAYWDVIQWPRNIYYDENNIIKWFKFLTNKKNAVLKKKDWYFAYLVDNITLAPWEMMTFEYDLEYHHMPLKKMSITYNTFYWDWPDIKLQSVDGCVKDFDVYHGWWRLFPKETIYLQKMIDEEYLEEDKYTEDFAGDVISYGSDANKLPWIVWDKIDRVKLLQSANALEVGNDEEWKSTLKNALYQKIKEWWLESLNMNLAIDLSILEEQTDMIEDVVDEITQWMCNWFSFGGSSNCKWLPVPFNQAFLAPGKYHLFGCWELPMWPLEWWIPMFFFPWTLYTPVGSLPIPWWLKQSGTDWFLWPWWWTYPSFIRIYAAPTLTAQLWIAICMWTYAVWAALPSPVADIAGNCIVFAVKPQCKNGEEHNEKKKDRDNPHAVYEDFTDEVKNSWICLQSQKWPVVTEQWARPSPFNMYSIINSHYEYRISRDNVVIRESQMDDILDKIQEVSDGKINAKSLWEDALKWRVKIAWKQINLSILDMVFGKETIDKLYNKYFADAKLTAADYWMWGYPEYKINDMWMIILETTSYIWPDEDNKTKNSIFIWDVDILWWDYTVNKIKWWIQQWIRQLLIDKWLDPQIRYIANQLTKMHVNIKLPDLWQVIDGEGQFIKNLTNSFWDIWSFKDENEKQDINYDNMGSRNKAISKKVSKWQDNNYDNLVSLNRAISNPFESLASLLNESNLINVSVEPVTIKVPRIFTEDINAYELYLRQWLEVNTWILKEWEDVLSPLVNNCSKIEDEKEKAECYNTARSNLDSLIEFEWWEWRHMQEQIYANILVLQEYRNFPFEIYEWIHVIDRYMSEIISLISNTIWYLSFWTSTNAERFVWYVDAIVLILNIIKTYQLVIDFSKDWWKNCGTCTKDTYDQYSCKLSLLCSQISLPIIQIPNFKLPNITLDLSDINLSLDLILPSFNFQPVRINLPDLPNLPNPPAIWANIKLFDLPNIPILPEPPKLPELPSFIPEVEIELPILPPAPEIPKLPNEIEVTVKIAEMIGKIYCIVKGKFGMVGEKSVKAKIEQLTQRTYEVRWIDNIMDFTNMISTPVHNYWLDYEISSHLDLQFNFLDFYSYLDTLTKSINNLTETSVNWVNDQANNAVNNESLQWVIDGIDRANIKFNVDLTKDDSLSKKLDEKWLTSDEIEYTDYNTAKSRLEDVLAYIRNTASDTNFSDSLDLSINKIENEISKVNKVEPNLDWLEKIRVEIMSYLDEQRAEYDKLANLINNDYDGFLAMLDSEDNKFKSNSNTWKVLTFNLQLFNVDSSTRDNINLIKWVNPYVDLMENKKDIIDWYWNAVNSNTANDLWLTQAQYLVLRDDIMRMKNQITTLYSVTKPISSTELIAKNSRVSTNKTLLTSTDWWARLWSNMAVADVIDPSVLSNWIYEKIIKWPDVNKLTKVVYSDSFVSLIWDGHYHTTHSQDHDIVLWDDNSIYLKCNGWSCNGAGWWYSTYYSTDTLDNIPYEEKWVNFDKDTVLKIADVNEEVKNRKVIGQTYDVLSFSWDLEAVDGYLIKLVDRIDYSYEKQDFKSKQAYYVLALPKSASLSWLYDSWAKLELLKKIDKIENLYDKKDVLQIVYYDANKDLADVTLSNVDRKWYYARIATLNFTWNTYKINSPWSNQIVAWKQIVWDEQEPEWTPELFRPSVGEVVSQGDDLDWYVWTWYDLIVNWRDNVALYYINLSKDWEILDEKYTSQMEDKVVTKLDLHTKEEKEVFNSVWIDQFWNKTEKVITVNYSIPEITITDISKNLDWKSVAITAELSQDIDQWNVSFQRRRWNAWKTMVPTGGQPADIPLAPKMKIVTWNPFSAWNEIAMYDKNGEVLALIDPDTAELKIQPGYEDEYEIKAVVQDNPVLQVCNKKSKNSTFSISLPIDECQKIEADNYKIDYLDEKWKMWVFNWWRVVHKDWNSVLFVSPDCRLYSEYWLEWTYDFDAWNGLVILTLYQTLDTSKSSPIKIRLKVKPLVEG